MLLQTEHNLLAGASDLDPIKNFIVQALEGKARGEAFYYDNVCKQLREDIILLSSKMKEISKS